MPPPSLPDVPGGQALGHVPNRRGASRRASRLLRPWGRRGAACRRRRRGRASRARAPAPRGARRARPWRRAGRPQPGRGPQPSGSSWDVGSSSSSRRGSSASADARQTRWSSPPESSMVRPHRWSASTASSAFSTRGQISAGATPRFSRPNATSFAAIVITTWSSGSWKTVATVAARSAGRARRVSRPATTTLPAKRPPWKWGTSPESARSSVDLPEPEGPNSATTSPGSSESDRFRSAGAAPGYEKASPLTEARATAPPRARAAPPAGTRRSLVRSRAVAERASTRFVRSRVPPSPRPDSRPAPASRPPAARAGSRNRVRPRA